MAGLFCDRVVAGKAPPGLFFIPQEAHAVGPVIELLLLVWTASHPNEWRNRIVHFPL
jgi:hypothetical protein